jgi:integrase
MDINKKRVRDALEPRPAPYFKTLSTGRALGIRKLKAGGASWVARYRTETGEQDYKPLGELSAAFDYDQAKVDAEVWFKDHDAGITGKTENGDDATVEIACRRYVEDRRRNKSEACAHDADKRFERTVYGSDKHDANVIAGLKLAKLKQHHFKAWRDGLKGLSKASVNRNVTAFRAAITLAVNDDLAPVQLLADLRKVKQHKNAGNRRTLYLDRAQRRALIDACTGALRDLIEAAAVTGCRAGELTGARVRNFDARQKTLSVKGKTGPRPVLLAPAAVTLFERRCEGRKPDDFLLTRDDGRHWDHSDWDELVKEAATRAKLPADTVLYTLRHSWITAALMGGMSTLEVSKIAGTSLMMIQEHYGHLVANTASDRLALVELV